MGKTNTLRIGLLLFLVSNSLSLGAEVNFIPESGVIFTEPSVDLTSPWDATTSTTTSTTTPGPEISSARSEPESGAGAPDTDPVTSSVVSAPTVPVDAHKIEPPPPATFRSKVPPSFRKYINEIRNSAAEIRWIKRDSNPHVGINLKHIHPVNASVAPVSAPLPEVVPVTPHPPVPTLPVPPIDTISAIIRDLEKQKREYDAIKDVHPKLHLIPNKQYFVPQPKLRLAEKPPVQPLPKKEVKSVESVPAAATPISGPQPEPSGVGPFGSWGGSGRWLWSWLGLDDGSKSGPTSPPSGPPYPYPHPPLPPGGDSRQTHPPAGQGFKYDCPFPHQERKQRSTERSNPEYQSIGKAFLTQYYALFDNSETLAQLVDLYFPTDSIMTFEGVQFQGAANIVEKFQNLPFSTVAHQIISQDIQPMFDGGVVIHVIGLLALDDSYPPKAFSQTFVLKPADGNFLCQHDIFRLTP